MMVRYRALVSFIILVCVSLVVPGKAPAGDVTVFGPETYSVGRFHFTLSLDRVPSEEKGDGELVVTKGPSATGIRSGYVLFNRRCISLRAFLSGQEDTLETGVTLRSNNLLLVFLSGSPGSSLSIEIKKKGLAPPPEVSFEAAPGTIYKGEESVLSWSTRYAETVVIDQGIGEVAPEGSLAVAPIETAAYTLRAEGQGGITVQDVTVVVENRPPSAVPQSASCAEDTALALTLTGSDPDGDPLDYEIREAPAHGTLAGGPPQVVYTPQADYFGGDGFSFSVKDGTTDSEPASVSLVIHPVNDPPEVEARVVSTPEDTALPVTLTGVDVDGDALSFQVVSGPDQGTLSGFAPDMVYTPPEDFNGTDGFTFRATDGVLESETETITIQVTPVNDPPLARGDQAETDQDAPVTTDNVLANDTDVDGDTLVVLSFTQPSNGTAAYREEGRFLYTPDEGFFGTDTFSYTVSDGAGGTDGAEVRITVNEVILTPAVTLEAIPATIAPGEGVTLHWTSERADAAWMDNGLGAVGPEGTLVVTPVHTTTYALTVTGPMGSSKAEARVLVTGDPAPLPAGSFGAFYQDLVPVDATLEAYAHYRFSLVTGRVCAMDGDPLGDVSVSVQGRPDYGTAWTDAEGRFTLPVEGGSGLNLVYTSPGRLTAHRRVEVPWNTTVPVETIRLVPEDPNSTTVTFNGDSGTVVTHQGTLTEDAWGPRSCSLVFQGDNRAFVVDEDGKDVHELKTIVARATEFKTPEAMPALLPKNSAYTYCAELAVDGAERVRFEKPVTAWVDNFLGFEVGEVVPVGSFDRDRGYWAPSVNGRVVALLDRDGDGRVDALDADGDALPDDMDGDGSLEDEVGGLGDAQRYPPGSSFWRFEVTHFTPWDCNWPYGPPQDAIPPNPLDGPSVDQQKAENRDCRKETGSFVEARSRIFHEDIPVPGTPLTLHYASDRVPGYKTVINVPVSGDTLPESLKKIVVRLKIAGRTLGKVIDPPVPNHGVRFVWDGRDHLGRTVDHAIKAQVHIGFVYDTYVYRAMGDFMRAFAQAGERISGLRGRDDVTSWVVRNLFIDRDRGTLARGWSLSSHHTLNATDPSSLHRGDGSVSRNNVILIDTVAGTGEEGSGGDGGAALEATLLRPDDITLDGEGNLYIADRDGHCVRRVDAQGVITTVAGNGTAGYSGDGGPATQASLRFPSGLAVDDAGSLFIADRNAHCVRKVDPGGIITTVAGTGSEGFSGDNGPAVSASLNYPSGIALDRDGNLYIADRMNYRVRKVDPGGIITTVAGTGSEGFSGDGGPALQAALSGICEVSVDGEGNLYIADRYNYRVRKVDASGIITTVAGTGSEGFSGDGGPATQASFTSIGEICVGEEGSLYIADSLNQRVRRVDASGIITTVVGSGKTGTAGDGGPAAGASLNGPWGIYVDPQGALYVSDTENHRVRKTAVPAAFRAFASMGGQVFSGEGPLAHIMSAGGLHASTIERDTGVPLFSFAYDEENRLIAVSDAFSNECAVLRQGDGTPAAIVSPDGLTTDLVLDADRHLVEVAYPDGGSYTFTYTDEGLMTSKTDPEGNLFEHAFDGNGRVSDVSDSEGSGWQYTRTDYADGAVLTEVLSAGGNRTSYLDRNAAAGGLASSIVSPGGAETLYAQTSDGLGVEKILPCGMEQQFHYGVDPEYAFRTLKQVVEKTPAGLSRIYEKERIYEDTTGDGLPDLITDEISVNGRKTTLERDVLQSKHRRTSPEGRTRSETYDPLTLLTLTAGTPGLYETTYTYGPTGRLTSTCTMDRETLLTYNAQGFIDTVTDPENRSTSFEYDPLGRVTKITGPDGSSLGFVYDRNGSMTVLRNPAGIEHRFTYNGVNRPDGYQAPLSGDYLYEYTEDRELARIRFPSGYEINTLYENGRPVQIQTEVGLIDIAYDDGNRVRSLSDGQETVSYSYDGFLRTSEILSGTLNQGLSFTYDNDFRMAASTYAGATEHYAYDLDGLLTTSGDFTIGRNEENALPESVTNGTLDLGRTFNCYGEVAGQGVTVAGQPLFSFALVRDHCGRITEKVETLAGSTFRYAYAYDPAGRLLSVQKDGTLVESYAYNTDGTGTRVHEVNALRGISGRSFAYSEEDHLLTAGGVIYDYDVDGFLTSKEGESGTTHYVYSTRGELLRATLPDGTVLEYVYDPLQRRIGKKVNGEITEKYLWQGLTRLLGVYDGSDTLLTRFEYADGGVPIAMTKDGERYYIVCDQVGSLRAVADSSGNVVKEIVYDSFGNILSDSNPAFTLPLGFAGGLLDKDTGLIRFGYRDYDPSVGRWTAKDPLLFEGGDTDLYGYCLNDPINRIDPTGQWIRILVGAISGTIGGYISGGWQGAVIGFFAGGLVGIVAPNASYTAGSIATSMLLNGTANIAGQMAGSTMFNDDPCITLKNINWGSVAAAAVAGGFLPAWSNIGRMLFGGSHIARGAFSGVGSGIIELGGQTLGDLYSNYGLPFRENR